MCLALKPQRSYLQIFRGIQRFRSRNLSTMPGQVTGQVMGCQHGLPPRRPSLPQNIRFAPRFGTQPGPPSSRKSCKSFCKATAGPSAAPAAPEKSSAEVPGDRSLGASLPGGRTAIKTIKVMLLQIEVCMSQDICMPLDEMQQLCPLYVLHSTACHRLSAGST